MTRERKRTASTKPRTARRAAAVDHTVTTDGIAKTTSVSGQRVLGAASSLLERASSLKLLLGTPSQIAKRSARRSALPHGAVRTSIAGMLQRLPPLGAAPDPGGLSAACPPGRAAGPMRALRQSAAPPARSNSTAASPPQAPPTAAAPIGAAASCAAAVCSEDLRASAQRVRASPPHLLGREGVSVQ